MTNVLDKRDFQQRLTRLDALLQEQDRLAVPTAKTQISEIAQAILELHVAGLERLLEHVASAGEAGQAILDACGRDEVVSGLLLLHGLHPFDLEERVRQALEAVRPALRSHGGNVDLVEICDGVVRLQLQGSCHSCPSSAVTMQQTIEEAIYARAPEVAAIEVEGLQEACPTPSADGLRLALPVL